MTTPYSHTVARKVFVERQAVVTRLQTLLVETHKQQLAAKTVRDAKRLTGRAQAIMEVLTYMLQEVELWPAFYMDEAQGFIAEPTAVQKASEQKQMFA